MTRTQRHVTTKGYMGIQQHHVIGVSMLAGVFGVYQFFSKTSTPRIPPSNAVVNSNVDGAANVQTSGIPVSYRANGNSVDPASGGSGYVANSYGSQYSPSAQGDIRVYFSPAGGCTAAIVNEINQARRQILIQAYSFTSEPIAAACIEAHKRGVAVFAVLDRSQETEQYSAADLLLHSGITTMIDAQHAIAHNKVILIDGLTLITGSFNFTSNAEKSNAENLLIIRNRPDLYTAYETNLRHHFEHSKLYAGKVGRATNQDVSHRSHDPSGAMNAGGR